MHKKPLFYIFLFLCNFLWAEIIQNPQITHPLYKKPHFYISYQTFLKNALDYFHDLKFHEAIKILNKAILIYPKNKELYELLGRCYLKMGFLEEAKRCFLASKKEFYIQKNQEFIGTIKSFSPHPKQIYIDKEKNHIYILDWYFSNIIISKLSGEFINYIPLRLEFPINFFVDEKNKVILVADYKKDVIFEYDLSYKLKRVYKGFVGPFFIKKKKDKRIFVIDEGGCWILVNKKKLKFAKIVRKPKFLAFLDKKIVIWDKEEKDFFIFDENYSFLKQIKLNQQIIWLEEGKNCIFFMTKNSIFKMQQENIKKLLSFDFSKALSFSFDEFENFYVCFADGSIKILTPTLRDSKIEVWIERIVTDLYPTILLEVKVKTKDLKTVLLEPENFLIQEEGQKVDFLELKKLFEMEKRYIICLVQDSPKKRERIIEIIEEIIEKKRKDDKISLYFLSTQKLYPFFQDKLKLKSILHNHKFLYISNEEENTAKKIKQSINLLLSFPYPRVLLFIYYKDDFTKPVFVNIANSLLHNNIPLFLVDLKPAKGQEDAIELAKKAKGRYIKAFEINDLYHHLDKKIKNFSHYFIIYKSKIRKRKDDFVDVSLKAGYKRFWHYDKIKYSIP